MHLCISSRPLHIFENFIHIFHIGRTEEIIVSVIIILITLHVARKDRSEQNVPSK